MLHCTTSEAETASGLTQLTDSDESTGRVSLRRNAKAESRSGSDGHSIDGALTSVVPVHELLRDIRERGLKAGRFARVPEAVLDAAKNPGPMLLYVWLMLYVPFHGRSSDCFPSIETLARKMGRSKSTIYKWLSELKALGLVEVRKDGKRTVFTVYAPRSVHMSSSAESGKSHTGAQRVADLRQTTELTQAENEDPDCTTDIHNDPEREILKRDIEREKQACSLSKTLKADLANLHLAAERADALLNEYGGKKVAEAIEFVRGQAHVRNPAGLILAYLKNDGWRRQRELNDYLKEMPDPYTSAERTLIAGDIVRICGSKKRALDMLAHVMDRERRLGDEGKHEAQREVARTMFCRAREGSYYVQEYFLTEEEEEMARLLEKAAMQGYWRARAKQEPSRTRRARRRQIGVT